MKILIAGGTGQIGTLLAREYHGRGDEVVVLTRKPQPARWRMVRWDAENLGPWADELEGADVVINLTGRSVNCRYTPENRETIKRSRVDSTRILGEAIASTLRAPRVWLQAGTATIYAHRHDAPNDETGGLFGGQEPGVPETWRFSIEVAKAWERTLNQAVVPRTRKVCLRSAMTMSPDPGGVFATLLGLVRIGLGGTAGDGRQYISWIHERDFIRALDWIIAHEGLEGAINLSAPQPLPNRDFQQILREEWGNPLGLPATGWMLEVGAWLLGTETELILKSRRVVPGRLVESGFVFEFPEWREAARELCRRWRAAR
jgi:uncharacterized protein (TIGR01777 family)